MNALGPAGKALLVAAVAAAGGTGGARAERAPLVVLPTITVVSTADLGDTNPGDGICRDIVFQCTLRAAIQTANASTGKKRIAFSISGGGLHIISPATALPAITEPLEIDGYSQPGSSPNTLAVGDNAVIDIELQGPNSTAFDGLDVNADNSDIGGLVITGFNDQMKLAGAGDQVIGDFLGTSTTGTSDGWTGYSDVHVVGPGADVGQDNPALRNVMGGGLTAGTGTPYGVVISADNALVQGNEIGVNAPGTDPLHLWFAVDVDGASNATIGGATAAAGNVLNSTWLSDGAAVNLQSTTGDLVEHNLIGTNATGSAAAAGTTFANGVYLAAAPNNTIADNVISGLSNGHGVDVTDAASTGNTIKGNRIGTNADGTAAIPNMDGIVVNFANGNTIGGPGSGDGNVVAASTNCDGILVVEADSTIIEGNAVGTTADGSAALPNACDGIEDFLGTNSLIADNLVSGNADDGILLQGAHGDTVAGNLVGTNADGTAALGNLGSGIYLYQAGGNTIGGTSAGAANVVSGNGHSSVFNNSGIWLAGGNATGTDIEGNRISTNAAGAALT